jgi:eukaryotic-like serine/threonine-protein kinase
MSKERHDIGEQEDVDTSIVDAAAIRLSVETEIDEGKHDAPELRQPGDIIARQYRVVAHIGSGGMSVVYKAVHLLLNKVCAVKVLGADYAPNARAVKRFQQEAQAVSRLEHRNIVKVSDLGIDDSGLPYLVMDFIEGVPLSKSIYDAGKINQRRTIEFMMQAADALQHAHDQGIVHRDVKPSNIIVTRDSDKREKIKIVDFGIAKMNVPEQQGLPLTQTGEVFGSPYYMSPEQCLGRQVDNRSDIYSLGCVMYECLFGKQLFAKDSYLETLMAHVEEVPRIDESSIGPALKAVLEKCLAKDKENRYQSLREMLLALEQARSGQTVAKKKKKKAQTANAKVIAGSSIVVLSLGLLVFFSPLVQNSLKKKPTPAATTTAPTASAVPYPGAPTEADDDYEFGPPARSEEMRAGVFRGHEIRPMEESRGNEYRMAMSMDDESRGYYQQHKFDAALGALEFQTRIFVPGGKNLVDPDGETIYLAAAYMHIAECYLAKGQLELAARNYRKSLRLFAMVTLLRPPFYGQTVSEYVRVLNALGKQVEASKMQSEYDKTGRVTFIPK